MNKLVLVAIITLFVITRFMGIEQNPPSVYWDEASIGYNAYSVLTTGADEWGSRFPVHFRAFGEFKLPVYIYSVVPFVAVFGLNAFSVRAPAVLFTLLTLIITYFLCLKITDNKRLSLFSSFFVGFTPWLFIFSRTGYEATAGLMFYSLGIVMLLTYNKSYWYFPLSIISFIIAAYSYNSFRIILPLISLVSVVFFYKTNTLKLKNKLALTVVSFMLIVLAIIPIARLYYQDYGLARAQAVGLTGNAFERTSQFLENYVKHFSIGFLFTNGDENLRSQMPGFGQLYIISLPLIILGFLVCLRSKNIYYYLVLLLILIGPIPAALTRESPHALRSLSAVPFYAIMAALGLEYTITRFKKIKSVIFYCTVILYVGFFVKYYHQFLNEYPILASQEWQYGYKQVFQRYEDSFKENLQIYVDDKYAQPYIFSLFYTVKDPRKFQTEVTYNSPDQWGKSLVGRIGGKHIFDSNRLNELNVDLVFSASRLDNSQLRFLEEIRFLNNETAFFVYAKK